MFGWFKAQRRRRLLAEPFSPAWQRILNRVPYYGYLSTDQKAELRDDLRIFVAEKQWFGVSGMEITDEMKVAIAAQACLLLLGIKPRYHYDRIKSLVIYPAAFRYQQRRLGPVIGNSGMLLGEAAHRSPIVLAWSGVREALKHPHSGENLVFHEFAHHLDGIDGETDGTPPLDSQQQYDQWETVVNLEFHRLKQADEAGESTLLDPYGATNRAEFFAVATECFFTRGADLRRLHPELYAALSGFYRQDPAKWPVPGSDSDVAHASQRRLAGRWRMANLESGTESAVEHADDIVRELRLKPGTADAHFSVGVVYFNRQQYQAAIDEMTAALNLTPRDSEALRHRGIAQLRLGRAAEALPDLDAALKLDADDLEAHRARAEARLHAADYAGAMADTRVALGRNRRDAVALRISGLALAAQGRLSKGISRLTSSIHADPNQAETYAARSHLYELAGYSDRAERDRVEAARRDPRLGAALSAPFQEGQATRALDT